MMIMRHMWLVTAVMLVLTACGQTGRVVDVGAAPTTSAREVPTATTGDATGPPATDAPLTTAETGGDPDTVVTTDAADLPGEPVDWPFTGEVGVVGVEADDLLNVRARPGVGEPIVARLDPLRRDLSYTGRARRIGRSVWTEISVDGERGWVNSHFARLIAGTDDITSQLLGPGDAITAPTLPALAEEVVTAYGLAEGYQITWGPDLDPAVPTERQRRIVISDGPQIGDLGEVTIDVVDLFDDSVAAERLTMFARSSGDGFSLRTVERTFFCWRGGDEVCV